MKRIWIGACLLLVASTAGGLCRTAGAEESGLSDALVGDSTPLTLKVGDLTGVWRLVTITTDAAALPSPETPPTDPALAALRGFVRTVGGAPDVYFTQGRLVAAGSESFLVAYRMQYSDRDFNEFLASYRKGHGDSVPPPGAPTIGVLPTDAVGSFVLNRTLKLVLLNVRRIGGVMEVRAYNLDSALAAATYNGTATFPQSITPAPSVTVAPGGLPAPAGLPATAPPSASPPPPAPAPVAQNPVASSVASPPPAPSAAPVAPAPRPVQIVPHTVAINDLRHIGDALQMYILDHDGTLPPLADAKAAFNALFADPNVFGQGDNEPALVPNPVLSEHKLAHIINPREFVAFYEVTPTPDGSRGVLFLDNHVATVSAHDWVHFKKASKMF